jgi:hypothetical protein
MTQTAVDDVWLREPRLLIPGQQPVGPVKADMEIVKNGVVLIPNLMWSTSQDAVKLTPTNAAINVVSGKLSYLASPDTGRIDIGNEQTLNIGTGDYTIILQAKASNIVYTEVVLGRITGSSGNSYWVGINLGTWSINGAITAAASNNLQWQNVVFLRISGNSYIIIDGKILVGPTPDTANVDATTPWALLNFGQYVVQGHFDWTGWVALAAILPFSVGIGGALDLSRDPYRLLIPAT